jgi:hypothetical protein
MPTLDIENLCKVQTIKQEQLIPPSNSTTLIILSKLHNIVNGIGYECSKTITTRTLKQNIFGFKSLIKQTTNVIALTQEDCQYMKLTRKCENKPMICEGLTCHLTIISEQDFIYATTVDAKDYSCQLKPKLITAESIDTILFGQTTERCTAQNFFCKLSESTIIWSTDIIHTCPFEIVINDNFTIEENNIIFNETLQLLLKIDSKITLCSQQMYTTTEGLYIVEEYQNKSTLIQTLNFNPRKLTELNTINDLIIADSDFKTREILLIDKLINQNMCKIQQTMINSFRSHIDTYHMIQIQGNQLIIYSTGQNIYIPTCQPIKEIKLIEQTQNCYNDQPIKFTFNNQTRVGYLTSNLIIKDTSYIKLCNLINDLIILPNSNRIIKRQNNKINVITQTNENIIKIILTVIDTGKINFRHNPQIVNGIDIISIFQNIFNINDTGTKLKIIEDGPST